MSKTSELRDKSASDLQVKERDLSEQLFKLRFQRSTGSMENPMKLKEVRREIARVKTLIREKQDEGSK